MEELRYKCPRCHYMTDNKAHYIKHLQKKTPCKSLFSEISATDVLAQLNPEKAFKCKRCNKTFTQASNLYRHNKSHDRDTEETTLPDEEQPNLAQGLVYLATSSVLNGFKLGYWRGTHKSLYDRYRTCYGNSLEFYLFPCHDCRLLEAIAQTLFRPHNLSCELYCSEAIDHYKAVLSHLCVLPETELRKAAADPRSFIDDHPRSTTHAPVFTHVVPFRN